MQPCALQLNLFAFIKQPHTIKMQRELKEKCVQGRLYDGEVSSSRDRSGLSYWWDVGSFSVVRLQFYRGIVKKSVYEKMLKTKQISFHYLHILTFHNYVFGICNLHTITTLPSNSFME